MNFLADPCLVDVMLFSDLVRSEWTRHSAQQKLRRPDHAREHQTHVMSASHSLFCGRAILVTEKPEGLDAEHQKMKVIATGMTTTGVTIRF